jgi:hypothetical protein
MTFHAQMYNAGGCIYLRGESEKNRQVRRESEFGMGGNDMDGADTRLSAHTQHYGGSRVVKRLGHVTKYLRH